MSPHYSGPDFGFPHGDPPRPYRSLCVAKAWERRHIDPHYHRPDPLLHKYEIGNSYGSHGTPD